MHMVGSCLRPTLHIAKKTRAHRRIHSTDSVLARVPSCLPGTISCNDADWWTGIHERSAETFVHGHTYQLLAVIFRCRTWMSFQAPSGRYESFGRLHERVIDKGQELSHTQSIEVSCSTHMGVRAETTTAPLVTPKQHNLLTCLFGSSGFCRRASARWKTRRASADKLAFVLIGTLNLWHSSDWA